MPYVRKLIRLISPSAILIIRCKPFNHNLATLNQTIAWTSTGILLQNQIILQSRAMFSLLKIRTSTQVIRLLITSLQLMESIRRMKRRTKRNPFNNPLKLILPRNSLPYLHCLIIESSILCRKLKMTISNSHISSPEVNYHEMCMFLICFQSTIKSIFFSNLFSLF